MKFMRENQKRSFAILAAVAVMSALGGCDVKVSDKSPTSEVHQSPATLEQSVAAALAARGNLPVIERSDWVNVKTDVTPAAVGDGVADDTAAIQAALLMMQGEKSATSVVYLPPGTYRIIDTLTVKQVQGGAIYGHGEATKIVWDGAEGGRMFRSNGFGRNLFFGLSWDGAGKAAVGIDHASDGHYETRVRHQYESFRNFTEAGIRVGKDQNIATAEVLFYDLLFENCEQGLSFLEFNDYNNAVVRTVFRNCGIAIHAPRGNVYVRDSYFQNSRDADFFLSPHSHSIRRCASEGAGAFVRSAQPGDYALQLAIQDCVVRGWKDADGAVQLKNPGPSVISDSAFIEPQVSGSRAIAMAEEPSFTQTLITANVGTSSGATLVTENKNRWINVPRDVPATMIDAQLSRSWEHRPALPKKIFDAKTDFGAVGDGVTDDSAAIQNAIDAAAQAGNGSEAYLPRGKYRIGKTLTIGEGDFRLAGAIARRTELVWGGADGGTILHADNAAGAVLSQLFLDGPEGKKVTGLLVTATQPGSITLDGVWSAPNFQPEFAGTHLDRLPKGFRVRAPHLDGKLHIEHCSDADILIDYWLAGADAGMVVSGPTGSGFLGFHVAVSSRCDPDLLVEDNASIVIGDFYTEQTQANLVAKGNPDLPAGQITISYSKLAARRPEIVSIDGFRGQVSVANANVIYRPNEQKNPTERETHQAIFPVFGNGETILLTLGNAYFYSEPAFDTESAKAIEVGGLVWRPEGGSGTTLLPDGTIDQGAEDVINSALDHLSALSQAELNLR